MKQVKIFSESNHSDLEKALNTYLDRLSHSEMVKGITYSFPKKAGELWSAVVEIDDFGGKLVFWASDNEELKKAVEIYGSEEKAPYVVRIPNNSSKVKRSAFDENETIGTVLLPSTVTTIERYAFMNCHNLFHIYIPNSVTSIEGCAFWDCYKLGKLYIPESVTKIGGMIANRVSTIEVDPDNPVYDSRNDCNAIIETATNTLINGCCSTKIPDSVTKIEEYAFQFCIELSSIKIPDSVREIGKNAFDCCENLRSVNIPDSITRIESEVFTGCKSLNTVCIPNSVNYIDSIAFGEDVYWIQDTHIKILDPNKVQFGNENNCFNRQKDGKQHRLWVPKGTKSMYERHPAFKDFDIIMEKE